MIHIYIISSILGLITGIFTGFTGITATGIILVVLTVTKY